MNTEDVKKVYPTETDAEGFCFENEEDEAMGIETRIYPNGNKVKKVLLPKFGKVAVMRELSGKEMKDITRFMNKDAERYQASCITVATEIDGQKQAIEFIESLKMKDYTLLMSMCNDLNF